MRARGGAGGGDGRPFYGKTDTDTTPPAKTVDHMAERRDSPGRLMTARLWEPGHGWSEHSP